MLNGKKKGREGGRERRRNRMNRNEKFLTFKKISFPV